MTSSPSTKPLIVWFGNKKRSPLELIEHEEGMVFVSYAHADRCPELLDILKKIDEFDAPALPIRTPYDTI